MRLNAGDQRLAGTQIYDFQRALLDAFSKDSFEEFLLFQLNRSIEHITNGRDLPKDITSVIKRAEEEEWTAELLQAARIWRPSNVALLVFSQQFGLAPMFASLDVFESKVRPHLVDLDVIQWRTRLSELEAQICYIEIAGSRASESGTGFLVGPDIVMTCFHVMEKVMSGKIAKENVTLHFDYKALADGKTVNPGIAYHLAEHNWMLDQSEYSPLDRLPHIGKASPDQDELDYVLLKINGEPGKSCPFGDENKSHQAQKRGWISIPPQPLLPIPGTALLILHHPDSGRLKFTIDTNAIIDVNANQTRVRYQTNTAHGSSGAPCFTLDWQLIALHHTGDPSSTNTRHQAQFNQGVLFTAIVDRLTRQGIENVLDKTSHTNLEAKTPSHIVPLQEKIVEIPFTSSNLHEQERETSTSSNPSTASSNTKIHPSKKQELTITQQVHGESPSIAPIQVAYECIDNARNCLNKAIAPFNVTKQTIIPAQFKEAIAALESMKDHIENLCALLNELTDFSRQTRVYIDFQADMVKNCIDKDLIPTLKRNAQVNFASLRNALDTLSQLLSHDENRTS